MFEHVGNCHEYRDAILSEYSFPDTQNHKLKKTHEWDEKRYLDLPTVIMKICHDSCVKLGDEALLESNPYVIIERHHNILSKNGKVKNEFAAHSDRDGPANGPCNSILYYYQIDEGISDVGLHFYEWNDEYEIETTSDEPITTFTPTTGDLITFGDNIPHCPGNFKTDREEPTVRGLLAIFIKHPSEKKSDSKKKSQSFDCCTIS
jgi:hypothetical protein